MDSMDLITKLPTSVLLQQLLIFLLVHHVLDSSSDFGEGDGLRAVKEHADDGVHTAEHLR